MTLSRKFDNFLNFEKKNYFPNSDCLVKVLKINN